MNYHDRDTYGMYKNPGFIPGVTERGPGPQLMGAETLIGNDVYNLAGEDLGDMDAGRGRGRGHAKGQQHRIGDDAIGHAQRPVDDLGQQADQKKQQEDVHSGTGPASAHCGDAHLPNAPEVAAEAGVTRLLSKSLRRAHPSSTDPALRARANSVELDAFPPGSSFAPV